MGNEQAPPSSNGSSTEWAAAYSFGDLTLHCAPGGRLDRFCIELKREFPALRFQHKSAHWHWRVLHWLLLIVTFGRNRTFNPKYTTTFGDDLIGLSDAKWNAAYGETPDWGDRFWATLMHEREHLRQFRRYGRLVMVLLYVFVPFPVFVAYFRARFERAGYERTLECWYELDPQWATSTEARRWWVGQFTSGAYGWMWVFRKTVEGWYDTKLAALQAA